MGKRGYHGYWVLTKLDKNLPRSVRTQMHVARRGAVLLSSKAMRITKLTYVRKRGQGRVNLELADGSTLELDAELAVAHQLKSDMVLTGQALAALRREQHAL